MAPAVKISNFYREGNDWFCSTGLPSDITVAVEDVNFHLHKFPLISKCGKIAELYEKSQISDEETFKPVLADFPSGPDTFLSVVKFCYGIRVDLTPRNIVNLYCAADYLDMTEDYADENLVFKADYFFHKTVIRNWKDCILALQNSESVMPMAEKLNIISKCLDALSMMVCTDPSLFGWPMRMYGSLQSPGGSILWNGINTGARIRSIESDWWFEDVSFLSVSLFERLVKAMEARGVRPENLLGAIMYYARKHLPGLNRWRGKSGKPITVSSLGLSPAAVDQKIVLETIEKLLPQRKGKSFCKFLLGLLRVALILGIERASIELLERRIGMQLELATLDGLLIPTYSDSDTLYDTDCVERIINHFVSLESTTAPFSPASFEVEKSPSGLVRKIGRLIDSYIAEIASDANLKPGKFRSLAEAIPESSRPLHDGLYRAIDVYLKAHPWLSENEKEELCGVIDCQRLSVDACAHASQNGRLPIRVILQVLFFEQMQLRTALASCLHQLDTESVAVGPTVPGDIAVAGQIVQRDGWVAVVRENQVLKVDMEKMRSKVGELEEEFCKIKEEMKAVVKPRRSLGSPQFARIIGCKRFPRASEPHPDIIENPGLTPRPSVEQGRSSHHSRHQKHSS